MTPTNRPATSVAGRFPFRSSSRLATGFLGKNAIDHLGPELNTKPVAFVSYGAEGGVRAVEAWRLAVANFNMFDVRNQVSLNLFSEFDDDGVKPNERRPEELSELFAMVVKIAGKLAS